ncbi:MAG TPA: PAS domain S-box protein [Kofleriaceae bacterium]
MPAPSDPELYRLFDRSPVGMYRSHRDGRFLYVNPALARMLGYTVEELLTKNLNTDIYIDARDRARLIEQFGPSGQVDGARVRWKDRNARHITVQIYGHIVEHDDGSEPSFDASVLDVTEMLLQHETLTRTTGVLELVVRQMPAIYWLVDHDLRILETGGAIMELLGYPPDQYVGRTLYDVRAEDPDASVTIDHHKRALAGELVTSTTHYRSKHLANTIGPLRDGDKIIGAIGTAIDVSSSRALERRMVDAQRAESLGVLAGGLAHDFNNLLVAILGNADLGLRDTASGAPGRDALENIRSASLRAAELTDQLLSYAGRGDFSPQRVAPGPVIEELLRITAPTIPPNITVDVDLPPDLAILGDAAQLRQVALNLLVNARDALERGGTITISGRDVKHSGDPDGYDVITAPAGNYVMLELADDGPGMTHDTRRRIFEPFFTTKHAGHGLGLAAVLGIVRAHLGGLRVVSELGRGARFQVLWPRAPAADEAAAIAPPPPPNLRTVLVIDDEDLVRDVVARMIEDLGYAAVTAANGTAGLALLAQRTVDAVLVDLTMPLMNGADVIAQLRAQQPALPVVLCSGFDRDRRGPVKADAYLPKPFRIEALEQTLAKILR